MKRKKKIDNEYNGTDCYPLSVAGFESDNEEDAWNTFEKNLKGVMEWVRGHKYWRGFPILNSLVDFNINEKKCRVYSRIIATKKPVRGLVRVKMGRPYPETKEEDRFESGTIVEFEGKSSKLDKCK